MENIVTWIGIVIFMVIYNESTTAPTPSETTAVPNPKKKIYCGMFACPNCEGWCSNNTMEYSCKYSCKYEGFELMYGNCPDPKKNLASDIYSSLYPMCDSNFKPYDEGAEKCCQMIKKCVKDRKSIIDKNCGPPGLFVDDLILEFYFIRKQSWVIDITNFYASLFGHVKSGDFSKFYEWCNMECTNGRLVRNMSPQKSTLLDTKSTELATRKISTNKIIIKSAFLDTKSAKLILKKISANKITTTKLPITEPITKPSPITTKPDKMMATSQVPISTTSISTSTAKVYKTVAVSKGSHLQFGVAFVVGFGWLVLYILQN